MTENFTCGLASCLVSVHLNYIITNNVDKEDGLAKVAVGDLHDLRFVLSEIVVFGCTLSTSQLDVRQKIKLKQSILNKYLRALHLSLKLVNFQSQKQLCPVE